MGRVIIKIRNRSRAGFQLISMKCGSTANAQKIVDKRNDVIEHQYYDNNQKISKLRTNKQKQMPMTFEDMEALIKSNRL